MHDGEDLAPNGLILVLDVGDKLFDDFVVRLELLEVEELHADGGELLSGNSDVLLR